MQIMYALSFPDAHNIMCETSRHTDHNIFQTFGLNAQIDRLLTNRRHHAGPEKFEGVALFLRLGLPSTLIRHENGTFRKRSSKRRNLRTPALHFRVDGRLFENLVTS